MTNLQNPNIPVPTQAVEIDKAVLDIQMKLDTNLDWLSNSYGRAYRYVEKKERKLYFPEVYAGDGSYYRVTPDDDKSGMSFFSVGKEENYDFDEHHYNYLRYDVGIVFYVNQKLINETLMSTEVFTQNLIKDVRDVLTRKLGGLPFGLKIKTVDRKVKDVYKEFTIDEGNDYHKSPHDVFRFNCDIVLQEDCYNLTYDMGQALLKNISMNERVNILLPTIDFSDDDNFNALTAQQKIDLLTKLQP